MCLFLLFNGYCGKPTSFNGYCNCYCTVTVSMLTDTVPNPTNTLDSVTRSTNLFPSQKLYLVPDRVGAKHVYLTASDDANIDPPGPKLKYSSLIIPAWSPHPVSMLRRRAIICVASPSAWQTQHWNGGGGKRDLQQTILSSGPGWRQARVLNSERMHLLGLAQYPLNDSQ